MAKKLSKPRVLVIDDSRLAIEWVRVALCVEFDVIGLTSAIDSLTVIAREQPDLLILDVQMPLIGAEAVVARIGKGMKGKKLPVILFSSLPPAELAARAAKYGADDFICKDGDSISFAEYIHAFYTAGGRPPEGALSDRLSTKSKVQRNILAAGRADWISRRE